MSNRARYETQTGEHLRISRGTLTIRSGVTGEVRTRTLAGEPKYNLKGKKLVVPVFVRGENDALDVREEEFEITKTPAQIRGEMRKDFVKTEAGRLINKVEATPETRLVPSDDGALGSLNLPNPEYEKATANLAEFCKRYGLDFHAEMGGKTKAKKKAKERREAASEAAE